MFLRDASIQKKLMVGMLIVCATVMVMTRATFFTYEYFELRKAFVRQLEMLGHIAAANSTSALLIGDRTEAADILAALRAEPHITGACLYDTAGKIFAAYPETRAEESFPAVPGASGYRYANARLEGFQIVEKHGRRLGTLYLELDTHMMMAEWLWICAGIALLVAAAVMLVAFLISRALQRQITRPILALTATARTISECKDYSARATRQGNDEIGLLADDFNRMLAQVQVRDESLRKKQKELLTIIENLDEGLAVSDLQGQLIHFNRAAFKLHDFANAGACPRSLAGFAALFECRLLDDTVLPFERWPSSRILGGEELHGFEVRLRRRDREWERIFSYGGTLVRDDAGQPMMAVITTTDITEAKQAAEEILRMNTELERRVAERTAQLETANRELESFSYSVSHDLRAPLRHIDGFAELLRKHAGDRLDGQGSRFLETISNSARRLGRLIDDLLVFSRMGRAELSSSRVDCHALVAEIIAGLETETRGRSIDWQIGELPEVRADPPMLRQVWENLVGNALKYTRRREVTVIEISHRRSADGGQVFSIRDNGAGFDMKYAAKLFGVFQRLHHAGEFEGTGIGLANVRRIVARHGGRTWAEGAVDVGATFYFTLPAEPAAQPAVTLEPVRP